MSEIRGRYIVKSKGLLKKSALLRRACCHPYRDDRYRPPSGKEIESLIAIESWTQHEFAEIVGVSATDKGSSTIRRWKSDPKSSSYRAIPYSAWRVALLESGLIRPKHQL